MTFADKELSVDSGSPQYIFEFRYGPNYFRNTNQAEAVPYLGIDFEPFAIHNEAVSITQEDSGKRLNITASGRLPVAQLFKAQPPSIPVSLLVRGSHVTDTAGQWLVIWKGRVLGAVWTENARVVTLTCEQIAASGSVVGLRRPVQKLCPYVTYGFGCGLNAGDFEETIGPFDVTGNVISASSLTGYPADYFTGGYISYTNPLTNIEELMYVLKHDSAVGKLFLDIIPVNIQALPSFRAYPGDDHTFDTCKNKFNNRLNYGGFPLLPTVNPYDTMVYS